MLIKKQSLSLLILSILVFAFPVISFANFTDSNNTSNGFGSGTHSDTQWDAGNTWVELDSTGQTNGSGNFLSRIYDSAASTSWESISWVPQRPLNKELPNSEGVESAYTGGNMDMTGNELLYHFNETSGSIIDNSGNSLNGSLSNATYAVNGILNKAVSFDGGDDSITIPNNAALNMDGGNFSVAVWAKWALNTHAMNIVSIGNSTYGTRFGFLTDETFGGTVLFGVGDTGTGVLPCYYGVGGSGGLNLDDGNWHHLAATRSGETVTVYVDGVERSAIYSASCLIVLDDNIMGDGYYNDFNGQVDELGIWSKVLTSTEVLDMYKRGALRLKFQVRSCDDSACSGETFVGPDDSDGTYFSELANSAVGLPSINFGTGVAPNNRYFQYKAFFESDSGTYSPELKSLTITSAGGSPVPFFTPLMYVITLALGSITVFMQSKKSLNSQPLS